MKNRVTIASTFVVLACVFLQVQGSSQYDNVTSSTSSSLTLQERVELEKSTFHWYPYKRIMYEVLGDETWQQMCNRPGSSIDEFPNFFTREQRLQGWIAVNFVVAIYLFIVLAFICDKYFLPTVERICEVLNITPDVAATTFMATATTTPEFFNNTISVFVAESDMGLGAIIGSMLFNTLGVAACASLFTKKPIQIDWWPITRDSILLSINIGVLVAMVWDGVVMWYETTILVVLYVGYWVFMFQNPRVMKFVKGIVEDRFMWCQRIKNYDIVNQMPYPNGKPSDANQAHYGTPTAPVPTAPPMNKDVLAVKESFKAFENPGFESSNSNISVIDVEKPRDSVKAHETLKARNSYGSDDSVSIGANYKRDRRHSTDLSVIYNEEDEGEFKVWEIPKGVSKVEIFWYFFTWPIRFILKYTIPNPIKYKKWFVASFIMCVIWIGGVSYVVFWMIVVIGDTFIIPEPVMGFTLMAFGGCMPEAISAIILARKGSGQMGVSNALGANSLAVLFSLGLPWFIKTMADGAGWTGAFINIESTGTEFIILGLLIAVTALYATICIAGYKLRKTVGCILGVCYIILATTAVLLELDILVVIDRGC